MSKATDAGDGSLSIWHHVVLRDKRCATKAVRRAGDRVRLFRMSITYDLQHILTQQRVHRGLV